MDKNIYDALYNKTNVKEIDENDYNMYKDIISREKFISLVKYIPLAIIVGGFSILTIFSHPFVALLFCLPVLIAQFALSIMGENRLSQTLNKYGISHNAYKEFKKSGGIERIKTIIEEHKKLTKYGFSFDNKNSLEEVILNYNNPNAKTKNIVEPFSSEFSKKERREYRAKESKNTEDDTLEL